MLPATQKPRTRTDVRRFLLLCAWTWLCVLFPTWQGQYKGKFGPEGVFGLVGGIGDGLFLTVAPVWAPPRRSGGFEVTELWPWQRETGARAVVVVIVAYTLARWSLGIILISFLCRIADDLRNRAEREAMDLVLRWLGVTLFVSLLAAYLIGFLSRSYTIMEYLFLALVPAGALAGLVLGMWDYWRHPSSLPIGMTLVRANDTRPESQHDSTYADPSKGAAAQLHWGALGMSVPCCITLVLATIANILKGLPIFSQSFGFYRSSPLLGPLLGAIIIAIGCTPLHPVFRTLPKGLKRGIFIAGTVLGILVTIWESIFVLIEA